MPRRLALADTPSLARPGDALFLAGALTPPAPFVDALQADPGASRGLRITTTLAPGIEIPFDFDRLHPSAIVSGLFMQPAFREAQRQGRFRALPSSYGGFVRQLAGESFDLGVIQVAPPDAAGRCSLGPSVEFTPAALKRCKRVLALVNPRLPPLPFAVGLAFDAFDAVAEIDWPLPETRVESDEATDRIAALIAGQVTDGATLQTGIGKVPTALARALCGHRRLKIHSGTVSDGLMLLAEAGALDPDATQLSGCVAGSDALYRWLPGAARLRIEGCELTHGAAALAALERFVAVNSALEVDLFGQCNLEHANGRAVSGAGGAPDFARAARVGRGGLSVVALNASTRGGRASRIVAHLDPGAIATLPRVDVDLVVTEFGVADLRRASVHERARALIAVAAPAFREDLERAWSARAAAL